MAKKPESNIGNKPSHGRESKTTESHASGIVESIEKNRVILISSIIAFFVILGLVLVGKQLGVQRHLKAGQMYTEAATNRNIEGLDKVVAEFEGSVSAGNALLTKADIQIDQGKSQDAISTLNEMATKFTGHPRHAQAYFMLGNIYHKSGDFAKARENYNRVLQIQTDGELSPITRIRLGDLELAEGNADKARQNYEESYTNHPGSPFVPMAESRLAQLKVGTPNEIARPKDPEPVKEEVGAAAPTPAAPTPAAPTPAAPTPAAPTPAAPTPAAPTPAAEETPAEPGDVKAEVEVVE